MEVSTINIAFGACTLVTIVCCFTYLRCTKDDDTGCFEAIKHRILTVICWLLIGLMLLVLVTMNIVESILVTDIFDTIINGSYEDGGKWMSCKNHELPLALSILSLATWLLVLQMLIIICHS